MRITIILLIIFAIAAPAGAGRLNVSATIFPLADVVENVGGDLVEVTTLLDPGQGPHTYEPTPGDMRTIADSDMVVKVGLSLDHWLGGMIDSAGVETAIVDCSSVVHSVIEENDDVDGHDHHHTVNPHYWLDPVIMIDVTKMLANELIKKLPDHTQEIKSRTDSYIKELEALDNEIKGMLDDVKGGFVTYHNSWEYFARRYNLELVGVIEESAGKEPSAKHMVRLVKEMKQSGAIAVMVEPQFSKALGETIAAETGVEVVTIDPIGGAPGRMNYLELMRFNAKRFD